MDINPDKMIAESIHYPKCWDTVAYPTLASALWEMLPLDQLHKWKCSQCGKPQKLSEKPS